MTERFASRRVIGAGLGLVATVISVVVLFAQVDVGAGQATRACGSAFDAIVDRSGWESWWTADLDDPDVAVRSGLVRTRECPGAVNTRTAIAAGLGFIAAAGAGLGLLDGRGPGGRASATGDGTADRLARLGRLTVGAGVALTLAGVIAVIVLVADADSTLFLYTDRLVVGVVGLIVLVPPMALIVIGRVLSIVGRDVARRGPETGDA